MTYSERTGGVASGSPAPTTVETESLILDDLKDTTALESLGVCLTLDLEDVERQQHNLTNTDQAISQTGQHRPHIADHDPTKKNVPRGANSPASSRVHDSLASLLSERRFEVLAIVLSQVIAGDGLTAILVDSLEDLVPSGVPKTWEERDELATESRIGGVPEDNAVQLARVGDL